MKIDYDIILRRNMNNVFIDVLKNIEKKGLNGGHHLYITFKTNDNDISIPQWLKKKYPEEVTIVIQYEYWNFKIQKKFFNIGLSFNDLKVDLKIPYENVVSFADPYANFGLRLIAIDAKKINPIKLDKNEHKNRLQKDNVIEFKKLR